MHYSLTLEAIFHTEEEGIQGIEFSSLPHKQTHKADDQMIRKQCLRNTQRKHRRTNLLTHSLKQMLLEANHGTGLLCPLVDAQKEALDRCVLKLLELFGG